MSGADPRKTILHVGCGRAPLPAQFAAAEWREVRVDIDPAVQPDVIGSMTDLSALPEAGADALFSSHSLEHLEAHEVPRALAEFRRVLRPQGMAWIVVPDVQALAEKIATGDLDGELYRSPAGPIAVRDVLWGHGGAIATGRRYMAHRTGFSAATLQRRLTEAGFDPVQVERLPQVFELFASALRPAAADRPPVVTAPGAAVALASPAAATTSTPSKPSIAPPSSTASTSPTAPAAPTLAEARTAAVEPVPGEPAGAVPASPPGASAPASAQDATATPEALFLEAQRCQTEGRWSEAEALYARLLGQQPDHWPSWLERGVAAFQLGRREEAIAHLRRAEALEPRFARTQLALGTFLAMGGQAAEAEPHLRRAVELDPANTEARFNLGKSLQDQGDPVAAEAIYRDLLRTEPEHHLAKLNLANALFSQWRDAEALPMYREAAAQIADPYVQTNLAMMLSYSPAHDDADVFEAHRDFDRRLVAPLAATAPPHANRPDPERRLRVAYLSRDLCRHSMRYFLVPLVAHHDHAAFEIGFYNFGDKSDEITDFYRRRADLWVDCHGWSDERLAARIRDDGIDILVELSGHTDRNRLLVVGRHPAPVQITYLGYPTTSGVDAIDYRISDRWIDPEPGQGLAIASTETPLRLAHGYFCYSPVPGSPKVGPLPLDRHGHVSFGSLNQGPKLNPPLFESWAEILRRLPQSRLVIQNKAMAEGIPRERVRAEFTRLGIDAGRLDFRPFGKAPAYLGTYRDIDIALDSYPYNGGTTTCEALWMGVPVVSRAGGRHVARLGMSILNQIGLPELVAADAAGYIDTAVALAGDAERLRTLRAGMRDRLLRSPLMDHPGFTRELEGAYREVWRRWCAGR